MVMSSMTLVSSTQFDLLLANQANLLWISAQIVRFLKMYKN